MEKDNFSTSFTFSGLCFLSDSFYLTELIFVTTHANLNYLIDKVKTQTRDANYLFKKHILLLLLPG